MSANYLNRAVISYFAAIITALLLSMLTSCSAADAQTTELRAAEAQMAVDATRSASDYESQPQVTETTCKAITKAGTQCTRKVQSGQVYCWQHGGATKASVTPAETGTCGAKTKAGGACKNRVKGGGYCHLHRG